MNQDMRVKDKVAFISGAGDPMGAAIARRLAEAGAKLILTDISGSRLASQTEGLGGQDSVRVRCDVRIREQAAQVVEAGITRFGQIDILVNVVGGIRDSELKRPFMTMLESRFDDTFKLNLKGGFHLIQLIAPDMLERAYGKVINIGSISMSGEAGQADYGAAKAAGGGVDDAQSCNGVGAPCQCQLHLAGDDSDNGYRPDAARGAAVLPGQDAAQALWSSPRHCKCGSVPRQRRGWLHHRREPVCQRWDCSRALTGRAPSLARMSAQLRTAA